VDDKARFYKHNPMVTDTEVFNRDLSIIYGQTDHFIEQGLKILKSGDYEKEDKALIFQGAISIYSCRSESAGLDKAAFID
jgi:hypothetical protein